MNKRSLKGNVSSIIKVVVVGVIIILAVVVGILIASKNIKSSNTTITLTDTTTESVGTEIYESEEMDYNETNERLSGEKSSIISDEAINFVGGDTLIKEISESDSSIKVEDADGGFKITTNSEEQRDMLGNIFVSYANEAMSELKKKDKSATYSVNIKDGYIDVYCSREYVKDIQTAINNAFGYVLVGQKIYDNTKPESITVLVNDKKTGNTVKRVGVSIEERFNLNEDEWNKK